jgi:hypothetical protein
MLCGLPNCDQQMPYRMRHGYCWWDVDHAGWVVTLDSPERQELSCRTLEKALAWCLVWLMASEIGVRPFRVG